MSETKLEESLRDMIIAFLFEHREPENGGWAPVETKDFTALYNIIYKLIELKWSSDVDGDRPISALLTNRITHQLSPFVPIPHPHKDKNRYEEEIFFNLDIAVGMITHYRKLIRFEEHRKKNKTN